MAMSIKGFVPISLSLLKVSLDVWFDKNEKNNNSHGQPSQFKLCLRPFMKPVQEKEEKTFLNFTSSFRGKLVNQLAGVSSLQQEIVIFKLVLAFFKETC